NLSSPNIYWIHADGMLSFNAVAKYFNDNQEKFLNELEQRGFEINKGAAFEAHHSTTNAIPALMNPYSYDNWIRNEFLKPSEELNNYAFDLLRMNNELQYAFQAKSYDINVTGPYKFYYPIRGGKFWLTAVTKGDILSLEDLDDNVFLEADNFRNIYFGTILKEILKRIKFSDQTYKAFISPDKRQEILVNAWDLDNRVWDFVDALYDILYGKYPEPRLTIIHDLTPHVAFNHAKDGSHADVPFSKYNKHRPLDYYPQHVWSAKVLINIIDLILEQDPDAVIIIQSDHGIHANSEQDFKQAFGDKFNSNTTKELWNSTMSAIRVPDKFKTGEEHYALNNPLNITRYLVNNFVGANNYEYLSPNAEF
ncbi:MAG: hypothetical protein IJQ63_06395, partial [Synergistaceae bacterium]|nr:hypothetical protein [Synergistaceae bacterium]MBR0221385.1 hypothetical protein [Synergistaceae bacterium]